MAQGMQKLLPHSSDTVSLLNEQQACSSTNPWRKKVWSYKKEPGNPAEKGLLVLFVRGQK